MGENALEYWVGRSQKCLWPFWSQNTKIGYLKKESME